MNKISYFTTINGIKDSLPEEKRSSFDVQFSAYEKNPTVALVLGLSFGTLGIDRFYLGSILLGVLKLFTVGGLGVWTVIDWFLIMGAARDKNVAIAREVRAKVV